MPSQGTDILHAEQCGQKLKKKKKKLNFSEKKKDKKKEKKVRWGKGRNSWLEEHQKDLASMWDGSRKSETESKK